MSRISFDYLTFAVCGVSVTLPVLLFCRAETQES